MSKGKYAQKGRHRRTFGNKSLALVLALVLLVGGVIGGTVAWLTAKTEKVENVFTTSNIGVELEEKTTTYQMIPGWTISKDPTAKVTSGSEDCYLFIKVEETGGNVTVDGKTYTFSDFIAYAIDEGWTALDAAKYPGVYYKVIDGDSEKNVAYTILGDGEATYEGVEYAWKDNEVLTVPTVTKEMMAAVTSDNQPKLSFTAYAVQLWKSNESGGESAKFTAKEAWQKTPGYTAGN